METIWLLTDAKYDKKVEIEKRKNNWKIYFF